MQRRVLLWSGAVLLGLWSVLHLAVGVYHTILFAQDPMNLFTVAYHVTVPSNAADDPALRLGSDAIEVYSVLLAGAGLVTLLATIMAVRGRPTGPWLAPLVAGVASLAYIYGLILPGQLTGPNAWTGPILYLVGVGALWSAQRQKTGR